MQSYYFSQPSVRHLLSSAHTPLEFARGFVRDVGTPEGRVHAARSSDRSQVASDVQTTLVLRAFEAEKKSRAEEDREWDQYLPGTCQDTQDMQDHFLESLFGDHDTSVYEWRAKFCELRALEQLMRPQPPRATLRLTFQKFDPTVARYSELECIHYFHLKKENLQRLFEAWNIPFEFKTNSGSVWTGEGAFLMYLRRMCSNIKFNHTLLRQEMGGRTASAMSEICGTFQAWLYRKIQAEQLFCGNLDRWASQLEHWVQLIDNKVGPYHPKFGRVGLFTDGTFTAICRPSGWSHIQVSKDYCCHTKMIHFLTLLSSVLIF